MSVDTNGRISVIDPPLPPATPGLVSATPNMFSVPDRSSYDPIPGIEGIDLRTLHHLEELSDGKFSATILRARPGANWQGFAQAWHYHHLDFQYSYVIQGWSLIELEGVGRIRVEAGHSVFQPGYNRHRVLEVSEDSYAIEISSPAEFASTAYVWDPASESYNAVLVRSAADIGL